MKVLWVCNIMLPVIAEALHKEASNKEGWLWHSRCWQIRRCPGDCR